MKTRWGWEVRNTDLAELASPDFNDVKISRFKISFIVFGHFQRFAPVFLRFNKIYLILDLVHKQSLALGLAQSPCHTRHLVSFDTQSHCHSVAKNSLTLKIVCRIPVH